MSLSLFFVWFFIGLIIEASEGFIVSTEIKCSVVRRNSTSNQPPKYWDKWEGKVINALVLHDNEPVSFNTLMDETKLAPKGLLRALAPLLQTQIIGKDGNRYRLINDQVANEWKNFLQTQVLDKPSQQVPVQAIQQVKHPITEVSTKNGGDLVQWIAQWRAVKNLNFPLEHGHFFLEGEHLEEFSRELIGKAQSQILVTNPYVDSCYLTTALARAFERKIKTCIVARRPDPKKDKTKIECQEKLKKTGMVIHYNNQIHAKIIVLDDKVAIVSSMNLYSGSSGGATIEAGMVSIDEKVVETVANYILRLLKEPESKEVTASNKYGWRT